MTETKDYENHWAIKSLQRSRQEGTEADAEALDALEMDFDDGLPLFPGDPTAA